VARVFYFPKPACLSSSVYKPFVGSAGGASSRGQTRDQVIVFAQGSYGLFYLAEYPLFVGGKLKDSPPVIGCARVYSRNIR